MRRFLAFALSLSMSMSAIVGCGTHDYAPLPGEDPAADKNIPSKIKASPPHSVLTSAPHGPGKIWKGLEWLSLNDTALKDALCYLNDNDRVDEWDALTASMYAGAAGGIIVRASGSYFLGRPAPATNDGHGGGEHGGSSGPVNSVPWSIFDHFWEIIRHGVYSAGKGALAVGFCETMLAGANYFSFDGILGQDFRALSAAVAVGFLAGIPASPWVWKAYGDPGGGKNPNLDNSGLFKRIQHWDRTRGFTAGVLYGFEPHIAIIGVSATAGFLVYRRLLKPELAAENDMPSECKPK